MVDKFWVGGTGNWNTTNTANWSLTTGGVSGAAVPAAGDRVFIDANSMSGATTISRATNSVTCGSIDFTGYTGTFGCGTVTTTLDTGNLTLVSGMTVTANTGVWSFTGAGTQVFTSAGKTFSPVTMNGTGTLQLADNLSIGVTRTFTLTKGTLDLNAKTLTCGAFTSNNANTRSIVWTSGGGVTASGAVNFSTSTNATFTNPTQGLITLPMNGQTLSLGSGLTFPPCTVVTVSGSSSTFTSAGSSITSITWLPLDVVSTISFGADLTINGDLVCIGSSIAASGLYPAMSGLTTPRTITVNGRCDLASIDATNIVAAGTANPFFIRNAVDDVATLAGCTNLIAGQAIYTTALQLRGMG